MIREEGFSIDTLRRVVRSVSVTATAAFVAIMRAQAAGRGAVVRRSDREPLGVVLLSTVFGGECLAGGRVVTADLLRRRYA